jgi:16S rRNA (uracil1498-N3)-methyltransferase
MPRFFSTQPLIVGSTLDLDANAARHVQVLRMQPTQTLTLFDGLGGEYEAVIQTMTRSNVSVSITSHNPIEREAIRSVHLALGVPANERMDWLVEKATELGVVSIQPLMTERGVLRLSGERAEKKQAHWQAIAIAACEQSGRNRVPVIHPVQTLPAWLQATPAVVGGATSETRHRVLLSLTPDSQSLLQAIAHGGSSPQPVLSLSGAEGGLSAKEEALALTAGYQSVTLGNRVLRAETAALAILAALTL